MRYLFLLLGILFFQKGISQIVNIPPQAWEWTRTFSVLNDSNRIWDLKVLDNYLYGVGQFTASGFSLDSNTTLTNLGGRDAFIGKWDSAGNLIWAKAIGGDSLEQIGEITIDYLGNIIVCGYTNSIQLNVDNNQLNGLGDRDAFLLKLDSANGNILWLNNYGSSGDDYFSCVCSDFAGDIYVGGRINNINGLHKVAQNGTFISSKNMTFAARSLHVSYIDSTIICGGTFHTTPPNTTSTLNIDGFQIAGCGEWPYCQNIPFANVFYCKVGQNNILQWLERATDGCENNIYLGSGYDYSTNKIIYTEAMNAGIGLCSYSGKLKSMSASGQNLPDLNFLYYGYSTGGNCYSAYNAAALKIKDSILAFGLNNMVYLFNLSANLLQKGYYFQYNISNSFYCSPEIDKGNLYLGGFFNDSSGNTYSLAKIGMNTPLIYLNCQDSQAICLNTDFQINATINGGQPPYSYIWNPANGLSNATIQNPIANLNQPASYTLTVTDASGQSSSRSFTLLVDTLIQPQIISVDTTICNSSLPILLQAGISNMNLPLGTTKHWGKIMPNGYVQNWGTADSLWLNTIGVYILQHQNSACGFANDTINITPVSPLVITAVPSNTLCFGDSLNLTASGYSIYNWSNNIINGQSFLPTSDMSYSVSAIDINGCTATNNLIITVDHPEVTIDGSGFCIGDTLSAYSGFDPGVMKWLFNGNIQSTINTGHDFLQPDTLYTINQQFLYPKVSAVDKYGNVFICMQDAVYKITPGGSMILVAGGMVAGYGASQLNGPRAVFIDSSGSLYISDYFNHRVQKWLAGASSGTTVAGGYGIGNAANQLGYPSHIFVDDSGSIFVEGIEGSLRFIKKWPAGSAAGTKVATGLGMNLGMYVDTSGIIYVAENNQIFQWVPGDTVGTIVPGMNFNYMASFALGPNGNSFLTDSFGGKLYQLKLPDTTKNLLHTFQTNSEFIEEMVVDVNGNIYVAKPSNSPWTLKRYNFSNTNQIIISQAGLYQAVTTSSSGCADTMGITIYGDTIYANTSSNPICQNDTLILWGSGGPFSYSWSGGITDSVGFIPNGNNTYTVTSTDANGCNNTATVSLIVNISTSNILSDTICANALPYYWNGQLLNSSGVYSDTLFNFQGCDSIVTLTLTVSVNTSSLFNDTVCSTSLPYNWNGQLFYVSGVYQDTLVNAQGCDSIATLNLSVNSILTSIFNDTVCAGSLPYNWNGQLYNIPGTFTDSLISSQGCDSLATLNLVIDPQPLVAIMPYTDTTICIGNAYVLYADTSYAAYAWTLNGNPVSVNDSVVVNSSGQYILTCTDSNGCAATDTVNIVMGTAPSPIIVQGASQLTCTGVSNVTYQWFLNNNAVGTNDSVLAITQNGVYMVIATDTAGCIGIDTLVVSGLGTYDESVSIKTISIYPNPSSGTLMIDYTLNQSANISITIKDLTGKTLMNVIQDEYRHAGQCHETVNLKTIGLAYGIYFIQLSDGDQHWHRRFVYGE